MFKFKVNIAFVYFHEMCDCLLQLERIATNLLAALIGSAGFFFISKHAPAASAEYFKRSTDRQASFVYIANNENQQ